MKKYKKWRAPPDGSCFFHSIAFLVGSQAQKIRNLCAGLVHDRHNDSIEGLTLAQWIDFETNMSVDQYIQAIQTSLWGGSIEMRILSDFFGYTIEVYAKQKHDGHSIATLLSVFAPQHSCSVEPLRLLYTSGNHYDALYVANEPSVKPTC
jgi:hypothetical protein